MTTPPLLTDSFLQARYANEFAQFQGSEAERALMERLRLWAARDPQKETASQGTFVTVFFRETWGFAPDGTTADPHDVTLREQFPVRGAGARGGTGQADLALGWFERPGVAPTPQVLCEFKDIRSSLDAPQRRKGNDRSPVQQCADYLKEASRGLRYGTVEPTWGIVSDMNEFRLYWRDTMPAQYQRFVVARREGRREPIVLLDENDAAQFQRFLFWKLFQRDLLLTKAGPSSLAVLLRDQGVHERAIENAFYREYHAYREAVFRALVDCNPEFPGTKGKLVRLAQRFLDRCLFVLFCEDMGAALRFPQNLLRDLLIERSVSRFYDPAATTVWAEVKQLFYAMRDGTPFGGERINRFNGGLFANEPELEALAIPNHLFCAKGQGAESARWGDDRHTLLYFASQYNFGVQPTGARSISAHTLGRIFEQSITDLEYLEAKAEGRPSLTELSKRKRDGVYYTPEWVTYFVVEHTVGSRLAELRAKCGLDAEREFTDDDVKIYRQTLGYKDASRYAPEVRAYLNRLDAYEQELSNLKVLDPACGSGAFLIQALRLLVRAREWVTEERASITATRALVDQYALVREVLSKNIYGVDINGESVEITRLALWLETALPDRPLTTLDLTIRSGNSLVGSEFYRGRQPGLFSETRKEHINTFDWEAAFPEVFGREAPRRGFDCVIGNPPYVKLQNFRQVDPEVADYLVSARADDGKIPLYRSTQSGNFDLYLAFIEKGIVLLNDEGYMGFIAPSVWLVNEYGESLRRLVHETRRLDRWVDFKDYQVFDEAITYTALQFYRKSPVDAVRCVFAPDGSVSGVEWSEPDATIPYAGLAADDEWILLPGAERDLILRLRRDCENLDRASQAIVVGIQTSADQIFHLERLGPGRYRSFAKGGNGYEVEVEDGIMRALVSGPEAKRYLLPATTTYLLFPYGGTPDKGITLLTLEALSEQFPKAWAYLQSHEATLRAREKNAFDDAQWYRFGRSQNIDKQHLPKLGVAQTVPTMRVFFDSAGAFCLNNVRVNGILVRDEETGWFLLGVLNGRVADFVFRRIAKPKEGGYFEANKQFIAPLPIPAATSEQRADLAAKAKNLQTLYTSRRDAIARLERRLSDCPSSPRLPEWLWEDVGTVAKWKERNPRGLAGRELTAWAKAEHERLLDVHLAELTARLRPGVALSAKLDDGVLSFFVDDAEAIRVYVRAETSAFLLALWRHVARTTVVTPAFTTRKLVEALLATRWTENSALRDQVIEADERIVRADAEIAAAEKAVNGALYSLYGLSADEVAMVDSDQPRTR